MAHNLKLNIWSLQFYDNSERNDKPLLSNLEVLNIINNSHQDSLSKEEKFNNFIEVYVKSFNNRFINDKDRTKAFAYDDIGLLSKSNVIHGLIKGGITGIQQEVFNIHSTEETDKKIFFDEVSTLPYFFFFWLPVDSNVAYLMTQSYTSVSINEVFLQHFAKLFDTYNIRFNKASFVTKQRMDEFYRNSKVYKVSMFKSKISRSARQKFNEAFVEEEKLKMNLTFSGFRVPVSRFFEKWSSIKTNLKDLNIENENDYDIMVYYENEDGKKASAPLSNHRLIMPSIPIPDSIKEDGVDYPDKQKILDFCKKELLVIQNEIKYNPKS